MAIYTAVFHYTMFIEADDKEEARDEAWKTIKGDPPAPEDFVVEIEKQN